MSCAEPRGINPGSPLPAQAGRLGILRFATLCISLLYVANKNDN